jgi:fatty acid desaturase
MFADLILFSRVLVYVFKFNQSNQAKFFWVIGILAAIGLTVLNILAYGPFVDVIGFILGCIICLIVAYLFEIHEVAGQTAL